MTIGPQIPTHLLPRTDDDEGDEVDEDEDAYGSPPPEVEPQPSSSMSQPQTVGPQHLPHASDTIQQPATAIPGEDEDEDEDENAYMPALPPDLTSGPTQPKRTLGPMRPRRFSQFSDDSDEEVGPMPAPATVDTDGRDDAVREFIVREERRAAAAEAARIPKKPVREEWMLVPPSSTSVLGSLDPIKLKARQFSRTARPAVGSQDNTLWTETPAEKQARLKDEVDGKRRRATDIADEDADTRVSERKRRRHDEVIAAQVAQYNRETRSTSLVDLHRATKDEKGSNDEKDASIWDHSRDMSVCGRLMDEGKRSKMITDARALGDRFGKGKGGGWL